MEIFVELLILLVATRACGEIAIRVGQPVAVGELIAGIVLAMTIAHFGAYAPFLEDLAESPVLEFVADFGIFFLVLLAGIEMRPKEMSEASKASLLVGLPPGEAAAVGVGMSARGRWNLWCSTSPMAPAYSRWPATAILWWTISIRRRC